MLKLGECRMMMIRQHQKYMLLNTLEIHVVRTCYTKHQLQLHLQRNVGEMYPPTTMRHLRQLQFMAVSATFPPPLVAVAEDLFVHAPWSGTSFWCRNGLTKRDQDQDLVNIRLEINMYMMYMYILYTFNIFFKYEHVPFEKHD